MCKHLGRLPIASTSRASIFRIWIRELESRTGVGNYFRPRATFRLYLCLAGQISVKKANSMLEKIFMDRMLPAGWMFPPTNMNQESILPNFIFLHFPIFAVKLECL